MLRAADQRVNSSLTTQLRTFDRPSFSLRSFALQGIFHNLYPTHILLRKKMPSRDHLRVITLVFLILAATTGFAQKGGNQGGAQGASQGSGAAPSGQGAGQGLQGFSFAPEEWAELTLPDVQSYIRPYRGRSVLCYKLTKSNSASQPFILQRIHLPNEVAGSGFDRPCGENGKGEPDAEGKKWCVKNRQPDNHWNICSQLDEDHPMIMGQELVVGIDISDLQETGINTNQVKLLNINVTSQQSTPLNPSPIRPSFPGTSGGGASGSTGSGGEPSETNLGGGWWTPLRVRPPGWHGQVWHAKTPYDRGDVVADASLKHFFRANKRFNSGPAPQDPFPQQQSADWVRDGSVVWQEMYVDPCSKKPSPLGAKPWQHNHLYDALDIVSVKRGGSVRHANCGATPTQETERLDYYWAVRKGTSGSVPEDPFSITLLPRAIYVAWPFQLPGDVIPNVSVNIVYSPATPGSPWQGNTFYPTGSVVTSSKNNGHYYTALTGGFSAPEPYEPKFPAEAPTTVEDGSLVWLDSGPNAPSVASVTPSGSQQGSSTKPQVWLSDTRYLVGDVIQNPDNGHYYLMVRSTGGRSGNAPNNAKDPFSPLPAITTIHDGDLIWQKTEQPANKGEWQANRNYHKGDIVTINGWTVQVIASAAVQGKASNSASLPAPGPGRTVPDGDIIWQDLGPDSAKTPAREPDTSYHFGQQVSVSGELYVMVGRDGGNSGPAKPNVPNGPDKPAPVTDGDLIWIPTGKACVDPSWLATHAYRVTDTVCSSDHHEYRILRYTAGSSGSDKPVFPVFEPKRVVDASPSPMTDGPWQDSGIVRPVGTPILSWIQFQSDDTPTPYKSGDVVYMEKSSPGHYYKCISNSCTGHIPGSSPVPAQDSAVFSMPPLTWQDVGTTPPSSVSATPPADQTVSLLNAALPQVHSLSYFNIAAGAVVTFKHPPTFGFVTAPNIPSSIKLPKGFAPAPGAAPTGTGAPLLGLEPTTACTVAVDGKTTNPGGTIPVYACPIRTGSGSFQFDPVLMLTVYLPPIDAEVPFRWNHLGSWRPAPTGGFSLASPTSNFFLGLSNEFPVRNVQLIYGLSLIKTGLEIAGPNQAVFGGSGSVPAVVTKQSFQKGFFMGLTFNLSNFIQSLGFGGSKGGQ